MTDSPLSIELAAQAFSAMGSEARLEVLRVLVRSGGDGLPVGAIQERTGIPASTLAHHIKFLASTGLVTQERQGRTIICRAAIDHLQHLGDYILQECCADEGLIINAALKAG